MTYTEIKNAVLVLLDIDLASSGDIADQVEVHMKRIVNEIAVKCHPIELLTSATDSAVVSTYTSIPLFATSPGLGITQTTYMKPAMLFVDEDLTDTEDPPYWDFVSFLSWLRQRRPTIDNRPERSWTINDQDKILLRNWPGAGATWGATLYYYTQPAAIVLANSPEFALEHHFAIVLGTAVAFPNLFEGDRQSLLINYKAEYIGALRDIKNSGENAIKDLQFKLAMPSPTSRSSSAINWGNFHTS